MLKIRLSRGGQHKRAFFRIVLTEHTKPATSGYKEVLGWFDPIKHTMQANYEAIDKYISNGAQPTSRVAKLLNKDSNSKKYEKFVVITERTRTKRKED